MLGLAFFQSRATRTSAPASSCQAIAAAVIGGTPLRGGSATVVGAVLGAILLSAVNSGLAYFNVPVNWSSFATGRRDPRRGRARQPPAPPPAPAGVGARAVIVPLMSWESADVARPDRSPRAVALAAPVLAALALRRRRVRRRLRRRREHVGRRRAGREGRDARVRLPDHDARTSRRRWRSGRRRRPATRRREAHRVAAPDRGQRAEAGAALPGRDALVQGRRRDDDADARPVRPPAADRRPQNVPLVAVDVAAAEGRGGRRRSC